MKKKVILLLITIFLISIVAACGAGGKKGSSKNVLDRMEKSKVLNVAFEGTYPPFNFLDDKDEFQGFDVDISNEIAKRLGVKTKFIATKWDGLIGGLKADKFDIIIGQMTVTEERKKSVDFTDPYVITGSVLITREEKRTILQNLKILKGRKLALVGEQRLKKLQIALTVRTLNYTKQLRIIFKTFRISD